MGLFSTRKTSQPPTDKVWKTGAACLKGMVTEGLLSIKKGELPLIVTLFEDSHEKVIAFLKSQSVPYVEIDTLNDIDLLQNKGSIAVLKTFGTTGFTHSIHQSIKAAIYVLGRYPALEFENKMVESLSIHFPEAKISYCLSLDDPLLLQFGADNLKSLMGTLGMKDDECIEHAMVSKALKRALEKVNKNLGAEIKTHSEEEWFKSNLKR